SRRRHTRFSRDWSSDVCSSDLQENWDFSQRFYFGKWLLAIPLIILFQILSLTLLQIKDINLIEILSMVLFFTYSIVLMVITEAKLKKLGRANLPNKEY